MTFTTIGRTVNRAEGPDKVTGSSEYAADVKRPGMLWGKVLRSPFPHAKILNIDVSRARNLPGVHLVITGADLPDARVGRFLRDIPILANGKVLFAGEKVVAVAAETPELADEALLLVDVEYEPVEAVFDSIDAMLDSAPVLHENMASYVGIPQPVSGINNVFAHNSWSKGEIIAGFDQSDLIFEHTFNAQMMHQAYIEPHACVVEVSDSDTVQIWANNKGPFMLREQLSAVWNIPKTDICINPCNIGGDFGGKGSFMDVPLCYYLSKWSGRPVKMVMDYIQELMAGNPRHPGVITLKTGLTRDGKIVARQAKVVFNSGAYGAFKPRVHLRGADHSGGPYNIPNVLIDSYMVYTNNVPCGHMRSPAKPQVGFAVESHMDMIAKELGLDPYEFRLMNILKPGDVSPIGESWDGIRAEETLREAAAAANWGDEKKSLHTGRGMAIADQSQGSGQSEASVAIDNNGIVTLYMSLWDTGTGASTVMRQIVAEALRVPVDDVNIQIRNTDAIDFESGPGGSRVTYTAGQAALGAANLLRERLALLAAEYLGSQTEVVEQAEDGSFFDKDRRDASLSVKEVAARAVSATGDPLVSDMRFSSPPSEVTSYAAQVAEVEVDSETGEITVNTIYTAHDVGIVLNPVTHQGQIEGGVIQGLGYGLMEEIITDRGVISTLSLGDYKIPTMPDIPELVTILLEPAGGQAPYQTKGIGENSNIPVAGAIANAVYDAVGVRITDLPITAEKVLIGLKSLQGSDSD